MIRSIILFVLLVLATGSVLATDTVTLNSGKAYQGTILGADDQQITLYVNDTTRVLIPHSLVKSVFFSKADVLHLLDGSTLKCKVLRDQFPDLLIVTETEVKSLRLLDVKHFFYNDADSLLVNRLPATDSRFKNGEQLSSETELASGQFVVGLSGAMAWPNSENWRTDFITAKNILGLNAGLRLGYVLNASFSASAGYEYATYSNSVAIAGDSHINNHFVFAAINWYPQLNLFSFGAIQAGLDIGLIKTTGNAFLYSFRPFDIDESFQFALRPRAGIQFSLGKNFNVLTEVRYLIAGTTSVDSPVSGLSPLEIDLNMLNISLTALYYINW